MGVLGTPFFMTRISGTYMDIYNIDNRNYVKIYNNY